MGNQRLDHLLSKEARGFVRGAPTHEHCAAQGSKEPQLFGNSDNVEGERIDHSITYRENAPHPRGCGESRRPVRREAGGHYNSCAGLKSRAPNNYMHGRQFDSIGGQAVRAHDGCLGGNGRRRTRQAAIVRGEAQAAFDPRVSEWSNPQRSVPLHPRLNKIGRGGEPGEVKHLSTPRRRNQQRFRQ